MMDNEQLAAEIQTVSEQLEQMPAEDEKLSKEERKEKNLLVMKKALLLKMKQAREAKDVQTEFDAAIYYGVLNSWFGKHPFLRNLLINSKLRWNVF